MSTEQFHTIDIQRLPPNVLFAHEYVALQSEAGCHGCTGHTMLTCASLCNHALLTHVLGQQSLANGVIHFVGTGMVQIFALEKNPGAADVVRQPRRLIQRRGPAHVMSEIQIKLSLKGRVIFEVRVELLQIGQCRHQGLGDKLAAKATKAAGGIRHR